MDIIIIKKNQWHQKYNDRNLSHLKCICFVYLGTHSGLSQTFHNDLVQGLTGMVHNFLHPDEARRNVVGDLLQSNHHLAELLKHPSRQPSPGLQPPPRTGPGT